MRTRFYLFLFALLILGLSLLVASIVSGASSTPTPTAPIPGWVHGITVTLIAILLGMVGWWVSRWISRREIKEDLVLSKISALHLIASETRGDLAVLSERVDSLPCRREGRGNGINGIPPTAICSMNDRDTPP